MAQQLINLDAGPEYIDYESAEGVFIALETLLVSVPKPSETAVRQLLGQLSAGASTATPVQCLDTIGMWIVLYADADSVFASAHDIFGDPGA